MKYDIVTFGSATRDIFFISKKFLIAQHKKFATGQGLCLALGSKVEVDKLLFHSGGGGANTATTFANQGFSVAYCGMVGKDYGGRMIIEELGKSNIDVSFIRQTERKPTNYSLILTSPGRDRTILVYRGASDLLAKKDITWDKVKNSRWFYLAPFSGKITAITEYLIDFAKKNKIKVALNPGYNQLTLPRPTLERILRKVDILLLNREEASLLTGIPYQREKEIFKKLDELVHGITIMTKGKEGVMVSDGEYLYRARSPRIRVVDRTGAGDSFGSGFVSGLMETKNIEYAIQLGIANSIACLKNWGARDDLLKKGQKWQKVKVKKEPCAK